MKYSESREIRNRRLKLLNSVGYKIKDISRILNIDEKLVKNILAEKPWINK